MAAHDFLKRISKCPSGQECITVGGPPAFPISIMEDSCLACLNRAKRCPGEALRIINLPLNLTTNVTHQYGLNSFKLHGLPTPRAGNVLGILGCNGIGKSTALNTLCGRLKPNLGRLKEPPGWADIMAYYRGSDLHTPPRPSAALCVLDSRASLVLGSDLQTYFTRFLEEELTVVHKPQLDGAMAKGAVGKKARATFAAAATATVNLGHAAPRSGSAVRRFTTHLRGTRLVGSLTAAAVIPTATLRRATATAAAAAAAVPGAASACICSACIATARTAIHALW